MDRLFKFRKDIRRDLAREDSVRDSSGFGRERFEKVCDVRGLEDRECVSDLPIIACFEQFEELWFQELDRGRLHASMVSGASRLLGITVVGLVQIERIAQRFDCDQDLR